MICSDTHSTLKQWHGANCWLHCQAWCNCKTNCNSTCNWLLNSDNQRMRTFPLPCRAILIALTGHSCSRWWCVVLYQLHTHCTTSQQYVPYHIHIICTWAHVARKEGVVVVWQLPSMRPQFEMTFKHLRKPLDNFFTICQNIFQMF